MANIIMPAIPVADVGKDAVLRRLLGLSLFTLFLTLGAATSWAGNVRHIISFQDGTPAEVQEEIIAASGSTILQRLPLVDAVVIQLPVAQAEDGLTSLLSHPEVEAIELDASISAQALRNGTQGTFVTPTDSAFIEEGYTWNVIEINRQPLMPKIKGNGVRVAILDTGIDPEHADFTESKGKGRSKKHPNVVSRVVGGYNARSGEDETDWVDRNGHGTHIAGIIAAEQRRERCRHRPRVADRRARGRGFVEWTAEGSGVVCV